MAAKQWLAHAYRTPVILTTVLPADECLRRVQAELAPVFSFSSAAASKRLVGSSYANSVSLRYRIDYRNDFRRVLNLTFVPTATGTEAFGAFVISPFILIFLAIFCGFTGLIALGFLVSLLSGNLKLTHTSADFLNLIPVGMFLFAPALLVAGLALSRSSERQALDLLKQLLEATELAAAPHKT